ncbi:MAG: (S)-ureidoglycine aminohydrolase [Chthoniobacter sp.]|jgi:(S)-ureidoglycine aminohydrolase|nr:(S)-ureidoglycine aminohydrolase [Chthoniobacter sp.]
MDSRIGLTRNILRRNYALITPDGYVASALPGWTKAAVYVLISAAVGARLGQWLVEFEKGGRGRGETEADELFFYVIGGSAKLNAQPLEAGGFGYVPPGDGYELVSAARGTRVLIFRKNYEPLDGVEPPAFFIGHEREVAETPFLGDPRARLKTLIPDTPGADLAVNIFTYDPGATLPFVETHVMEHGMLFLTGSGVYRLGDDWHPVQAGDALWIAPYCPQWFIAAGPEPARYIYYKDVNRTPL